MKRTRSIDLSRFRKVAPSASRSIKPLVFAVAATLIGCSAKEEQVKFVTSASDCAQNSPLSAEQCEVAYKQAVEEAERSGPKYRHRYECETEFGDRACQQNSSGFFSPFMTGFLVSSALNSLSPRYNPVYNYGNPNSNYRNRLMLSDGTVVGRSGSRNYSLPQGTASKKMPVATKTVSRGGFGSSAAAKSNWGSSRSSGWGG